MHQSLRTLIKTIYIIRHTYPTVHHGLVGVNALAPDKVLNELLHLGDADGAPNPDDFVLELHVIKHWHPLEQVNAQLLELNAGDLFREVKPLHKQFHLNTRLSLDKSCRFVGLAQPGECLRYFFNICCTPSISSYL